MSIVVKKSTTHCWSEAGIPRRGKSAYIIAACRHRSKLLVHPDVKTWTFCRRMGRRADSTKVGGTLDAGSHLIEKRLSDSTSPKCWIYLTMLWNEGKERLRMVTSLYDTIAGGAFNALWDKFQ